MTEIELELKQQILEVLEEEGESVELEEDYKEYAIMITCTDCNSFFYWIGVDKVDIPFRCFDDALEAAKAEVDELF